MPLLDRLQFSIPISTTINAPIDIVWEALTDIQSYPTIFTHYVKTEPLDRRVYSSQHMSSAAASGGGSVQSGSQPSSQTNTVDPSSSSLLGSKWLVTRKSVVEKQVFSAKYVVTQYNNHEDEEDTNNPRSFTLSSHDVLGCTVSVKIIVETTEGPPPGYTEFKRVVQRMSKTKTKAGQSSQQAVSITIPEHTRVTIILSLIPFQFFIKLLGVMCCLCLIKSRTRLAAERDLEDLTRYCEEKAISSRRIEEEERDVDDNDMPVAKADGNEDDTKTAVKEEDKATLLPTCEERKVEET